MTDDDFLQSAINETITIVPYDPDWPRKFELEKARLNFIFPGRFLAIEHIGSTAVPGLAAKPIIDIAAAVPSMAEADALLPELCANGYTTSAEFNATIGDRRWLMRQSEGKRTHHLHLVLLDGEDWKKKVRFRDLLRSSPEAAKRYAALKQRLADEMGSDREAYTSGKTGFIEGFLETLAPKKVDPEKLGLDPKKK